jgi:hypothetical protein
MKSQFLMFSSPIIFSLAYLWRCEFEERANPEGKIDKYKQNEEKNV